MPYYIYSNAFIIIKNAIYAVTERTLFSIEKFSLKIHLKINETCTHVGVLMLYVWSCWLLLLLFCFNQTILLNTKQIT